MYTISPPIGMPEAMRVILTSKGLGHLGDVMGRGVPLDGRVGGDDKLPYPLAADPLFHLGDPDLFRPDALYRVYHAVEYVIAVGAGIGRFDHH